MEDKIMKIELIDPSRCVFNIYAIEERMKELGALEDIECEVIESILPPGENNQVKQ